MPTASIDTIHLIEKLRAAGFSQQQAESIIYAVGTAQNELATKEDLKQFVETQRAVLKPELSALKWSSLFILFVVILVLSLALYDALRDKQERRAPFRLAAPHSYSIA